MYRWYWFKKLLLDGRIDHPTVLSGESSRGGSRATDRRAWQAGILALDRLGRRGT